MSSVSAMRTALENTLSAALGDIMVYPDVQSVQSLPALLIEPFTGEFSLTMQAGTDEWVFFIYILTSLRDPASAQSDLDAFISGSGDQSIRAIIRANRDCGLNDTTFTPIGVKGYGGNFKEAGIQMTGAILMVHAYTDGNV